CIQIKKETAKKLKEIQLARHETYNDIIIRLLKERKEKKKK
ncbi:unnamed protein product, partial [marine sediment metagenome]